MSKKTGGGALPFFELMTAAHIATRCEIERAIKMKYSIFSVLSSIAQHPDTPANDTRRPRQPEEPI